LSVFHSLSRNLQEILKKASCLGQHFNLCDLAYLLDFSPVQLSEIIQSDDTPQFLVRQHMDQYNLQQQDSREPNSTTHGYSFRHIQIMQAIYDSQSLAHRSATHKSAAEFYEKALTDGNRDFILPTIVHHYLRTANIEKQIQYLEEQSLADYNRGHYREARNTLYTLRSVADSNPHAVKDPSRKAYWISQLAIANIESKDLEVKSLCIEALKLVGRSWPEAGGPAKRAMYKEMVKFFTLWWRTRGGTAPAAPFFNVGWLASLFGKILSSKSTKVSPELVREGQPRVSASRRNHSSEAERVHKILLLTYRAMYRYGIYTSTLSKEQFGLVIFTLCNLQITHAHASPAEWAHMCYMASFGFTVASPKASATIFEQAVIVEKNAEDASPAYRAHQLAGLLYYQRGLLGEAERCFTNFQR
jgi:tetratricopeptide (TPR) repeat protein